MFSKAIVDVIVDVGGVSLGTASLYVPEIYFNFFFKQCKIHIGAKNTGATARLVKKVLVEHTHRDTNASYKMCFTYFGMIALYRCIIM